MGFTVGNAEIMRLVGTATYGVQAAIGSSPYSNYRFTVNGSAVNIGGTWQVSDKRYKKIYNKLQCFIKGTKNKRLQL